MTKTNVKIENYNTNAKIKAQKTGIAVSKTATYIFLAIMALVVLIPFYWMLNVSFQGLDETLNSTESNFFPAVFSPQNYIKVFQIQTSAGDAPTFMGYLANTMIVAVASTIGGTIFSILVAFSLARLNFKGKELIFTLLLATMMIPGEMMVITNYVTVANLGWANADGVGSYYAMIFPFLISIFHIYLLRQTFKQIPNELYYAAKVDGCGDFKYLYRVMIPMAKSSIITIVILKIMGTWNAYIWPDIVAHSRYKLITSWLRGSFVDQTAAGSGRNLLNYQMAATVIVTVPLLLLFVIFRKYIMTGVSRSGVKG